MTASALARRDRAPAPARGAARTSWSSRRCRRSSPARPPTRRSPGSRSALRAKGETAGRARDARAHDARASPSASTSPTSTGRSSTRAAPAVTAPAPSTCRRWPRSSRPRPAPRVAKHGGRAASSQCGSADVLEALGVVIDLGPDGVARMRARGRHRLLLRAALPLRPALRRAGAARARHAHHVQLPRPARQPGGRPAPDRSVSSDPAMAERVIGAARRARRRAGARVLRPRRARRAHRHHHVDRPRAPRRRRSRVYDVDPADFGIPVPTTARSRAATPPATPTSCTRSSPARPGPIRDIVALNAAAALVVADLAADLGAGVELAGRDPRRRPGAVATLDALVRVTRRRARSRGTADGAGARVSRVRSEAPARRPRAVAPRSAATDAVRRCKVPDAIAAVRAAPSSRPARRRRPRRRAAARPRTAQPHHGAAAAPSSGRRADRAHGVGHVDRHRRGRRGRRPCRGHGQRRRHRRRRGRTAQAHPAREPATPRRAKVRSYWRVVAWVVAVPLGFVITAWPAYEFGLIEKDDVLDVFVGSRHRPLRAARSIGAADLGPRHRAAGAALRRGRPCVRAGATPPRATAPRTARRRRTGPAGPCPVARDHVRYRCSGCGNLTRFDVVAIAAHEGVPPLQRGRRPRPSRTRGARRPGRGGHLPLVRGLRRDHRGARASETVEP